MTYKINFQAYSNNFALPQEIVDADFDKLKPVYLKTILLIFKNSSKNYSSNLISNLLNVSEEEVDSAIKFWIEKGLLSDEQEEVVITSPTPIILSKKINQTVLQKTDSGELAYLIENMENQLNRPVTPVEYKTILHILEFIKLPADVVIMAISYCVSIDKANARYIEKICTVWADEGITTHEKAEKYLTMLEQSKQNENKIKKLFGINDRALIESEKKFISVWVNEFQFDVDMVKLAYEKTISAISKLSFPYMNKILATWHEKGFKSARDISGEVSSSKVSSDASSSYDIEEIDKFWDNVPKLV